MPKIIKVAPSEFGVIAPKTPFAMMSRGQLEAEAQTLMNAYYDALCLLPLDVVEDKIARRARGGTLIEFPAA
jgi:hypothetical protein